MDSETGEDQRGLNGATCGAFGNWDEGKAMRIATFNHENLDDLAGQDPSLATPGGREAAQPSRDLGRRRGQGPGPGIAGAAGVLGGWGHDQRPRPASPARAGA